MTLPVGSTTFADGLTVPVGKTLKLSAGLTVTGDLADIKGTIECGAQALDVSGVTTLTTATSTVINTTGTFTAKAGVDLLGTYDVGTVATADQLGANATMTVTTASSITTLKAGAKLTLPGTATLPTTVDPTATIYVTGTLTSGTAVGCNVIVDKIATGFTMAANAKVTIKDFNNVDLNGIAPVDTATLTIPSDAANVAYTTGTNKFFATAENATAGTPEMTATTVKGHTFEYNTTNKWVVAD